MSDKAFEAVWNEASSRDPNGQVGQLLYTTQVHYNCITYSRCVWNCSELYWKKTKIVTYIHRYKLPSIIHSNYAWAHYYGRNLLKNKLLCTMIIAMNNVHLCGH